MPVEATIAPPPSLDWDPYDEQVLANPYPFFEALRETAPVVFIPKYGIYAVGRHDEVTTVLRDYERFTSESGVGIADARKPGANARPRSALLEVDPPQHTRVRSVVRKIMSPGIVRQWKDAFTQEAGRFLDRLLAERTTFDGVEDLAEAFIMTAFPLAVGVRLEKEATKAIGFMVFNQTGPQNALWHAGMAVGAPYLDWFEQSCQRESVVPGSLADQIFQAEDEGLLEAGVASNIIRSFVRGGTDTTIAGLGFLLNQFAAHADQWELLKSNPGKLKMAYDEAVRFESPFHVTYRATAKDCELSGYALEFDRKVAVFPGAANRDPRKWDQPDRFDLNRQVAGMHMSFGTADHNCVGQMIARLEAECLVGALLERIDRLELAGEPRYRLLNQVHTLDTLPLRVTLKA